MDKEISDKVASLSVLGEPLEECGCDPVTGFYRDGYCDTGPLDSGSHTVCAVMTEEFLEYTREQGNDLSTPMSEYHFPGLKAGDHWCVCAMRWQQAFKDGKAPKVKLSATHAKALQVVNLADLKAKAA